jgi:hypothetical protein
MVGFGCDAEHGGDQIGRQPQPRPDRIAGSREQTLQQDQP